MPQDTPDYGQAAAPAQLTLITVNGTGAVVGTQTATVGAAVHALMLYSTATSVNWFIKGVQSGLTYGEVAGLAGATGPVIVPWFSALDNQVQLTNTGAGVTNGSLTTVVAIYDTMAVALFGIGSKNVVAANAPLIMPVMIADPGSLVTASVNQLSPAGVINKNGLAVIPSSVQSGSIGAGSITAAAGGTIITVAAGTEWLGTVWVAGVGSAGGASAVDVQTGGTATPPAGTSLARIQLPNSATPIALAVSNVYVAGGVSVAGTIVLVASGAAAVAAGAAGLFV